MSDPTTTNAGLSLSDSMVNTVMETAMSAAEAQIISAVPELGVPVVKQVLELVLKLATGFLQKELLRVATFVVVDAQTSTEQSNLLKAAGVLAAAELTENADAIAKATEDFKAALGSLIHFDGS